jgi:hypothetical protein
LKLLLNDIQANEAAQNHDLDFGVRQFRNLASQCKFPWLLANVLDPALGKDIPLGNVGRTTALTSSNGIKVGVIGLGEREWLVCLDLIRCLNEIEADHKRLLSTLFPRILIIGQPVRLQSNWSRG